ncbi:AMP-binding protein [Streptomyces sp. 3MP-14]|uniref:AMP-binding protein n=1 Tax=Streptomyces mimosae TaxID=2586635 RepID=A0A5N5ZZ02_9ACTN|nr:MULTISPECIES: fatty acid--CoA ligase family protein [Streptomyces]KAB8161724.1 AMP-binding protein [Streptomyces mimosae]KAB8175008.1 AMP-binding protein [Streptomyces sp. 3MP-14]
MTVERETLLELLRRSRGSVVVDGRRHSATELVAAARGAAAGLAARGLGRDDGVLLVDDGGGVELLASLLGAWWVGARPAVVAASAEPDALRAIRDQTGAALLVRAGPSPEGDAAAYAELLAADAASAPAERCRPGDIALDIASSGTTGTPKCVSFSHAGLANNVGAYARRLELTGDDVLYSPLPLSVAGVLGMVLLPGLLAGATVHVGRLGGARIAKAHRQVRLVRPTLVYGVPYMYEVLARGGPGDGYDALRWAICSSAPLPGATFDRVSEHLGVPPRSSYCLAEAGTVTLNTSSDPATLRETVGEPLDGMTVRVEPAADGSSGGRIVVGGSGHGVGYREAGVLRPFPDGEVRTSDLGTLDGGTLTLAGRADQVIQVAGQNVDLSHVHRLVSGCPGLGDFALLVEAHPRLGPVPVLVAESRSLSVSPRQVLAFCRSVLRDVEVPREVRVVAELPRTDTGKVRLTSGGRT